MSDDRAYRILVTYEGESNVFHARVPELEIDVEADTRVDAVALAEQQIEAQMESRATAGDTVPKAVDSEPVVEELTFTLTPMVAKDLAYFAHRNKTSKEALAAQILAHGVARLYNLDHQEPRQDRRDDRRDDRGDNRQRGKGKGRGRGHKREGHRPDLDDQSNFLAYLREQERGGGGGRGGGGRGR